MTKAGYFIFFITFIVIYTILTIFIFEKEISILILHSTLSSIFSILIIYLYQKFKMKKE